MAISFMFVALCLAGSALALPYNGRCPELETESNFDVSRYLGQWYENRKNANFEGAAKCVIAKYNPGENGLIDIVNSYISTVNGEAKSVKASLRIPDPTDASKMKIRYSFMPPGVEGDYWVLSTDYESYAVVYSCSDRKGVDKYAWILTRDRKPSKAVVDQALAVLENSEFDTNQLVETDQTHC